MTATVLSRQAYFFVQYLFFAKIEKGEFFSKKTIKIIGVPLLMKYVLRASSTVAKKKL